MRDTLALPHPNPLVGEGWCEGFSLLSLRLCTAFCEHPSHRRSLLLDFSTLLIRLNGALLLLCVFTI
jgi:hypothetical protein